MEYKPFLKGFINYYITPHLSSYCIRDRILHTHTHTHTHLLQIFYICPTNPDNVIQLHQRHSRCSSAAFIPAPINLKVFLSPLICVNNLSVNKTGQHGKTRTSWTDWATRTRPTGSKGEHTQIIKSWPYIYVFSNLTAQSYTLLQGDQGSQGVSGPRGPPGEGMPGSKVSGFVI